MVRYSKKYLDKIINDPLPPLKEEERIYLKVSYPTRGVAQYCHCGFDRERKLWFTGIKNRRLEVLVKFYGVHENTSDIARALLAKELEEREEYRKNAKRIEEEEWFRREEEWEARVHEEWKRMHDEKNELE